MSKVPYILFDTATLLLPGRLHAWRAAMPAYDLFVADGSDADAFGVRSNAWMLGDLVVTTTQLSPVRVVRSAQKRAADGFNQFSILFTRQGHWAADADGRDLAIGPGQIVMFDLSRPFQMTGSECDVITLTVTRAAMEAAGGRVGDDAHGLIFRELAARVVADHAMLLIRQLPTMEQDDVAAALKGTVGLLAACIATSAAADAEAAPERETKIRLRVSRYLDQNLQTRDLTSRRIGKGVGVSRSVLYRAFEPLGGVAEYLRARRLEAAHALLEDRSVDRGIGDIARGFGFISDAHFSRAFRRRYGYSPRQARHRQAEGLRDMAELIDTHAGAELFNAWINQVAARPARRRAGVRPLANPPSGT